jgi:hypothetical protein
MTLPVNRTLTLGTLLRYPRQVQGLHRLPSSKWQVEKVETRLFLVENYIWWIPSWPPFTRYWQQQQQQKDRERKTRGKWILPKKNTVVANEYDCQVWSSAKTWHWIVTKLEMLQAISHHAVKKKNFTPWAHGRWRARSSYVVLVHTLILDPEQWAYKIPVTYRPFAITKPVRSQ